MGRRLLVTLLVALTACAGAASAAARVDGDPLAAQEWWLADVGADRATPPGPGVPIGIVDSGVDPTHEEFSSRPATTFLNAQTVLGGDEFHGTAVASVAAAPDNGVGMDGVYPQAALEIWDGSPAPGGLVDMTAIAGIDAIASHCPAVISLSFSSTEQDPSLEAAILNAVKNGCLVVAATGNNADYGSPPSYPADWPHVFTVAATDESDRVAPFSTVSAANDISAPGVDITAAVPTAGSGTGYQSGFGGTSFSTPIVAAAAAWVWTVRPELSAGQLAEVLRRSARDIGPPGFDNASGWGIVDIPAALAYPTPPNDPGEPNDDVAQVKPGDLSETGEPPLTTPTKQSNRIAGSLDSTEDPRDVYRIWIPAHKVVRVSVSGSAGAAAARIWGPKTVSTREGLMARRRDLRGPAMAGGKKGTTAYVEVLLTSARDTTRYVLSVTASRR